jgi:hypothetical protein
MMAPVVHAVTDGLLQRFPPYTALISLRSSSIVRTVPRSVTSVHSFDDRLKLLGGGGGGGVAMRVATSGATETMMA